MLFLPAAAGEVGGGLHSSAIQLIHYSIFCVLQAPYTIVLCPVHTSHEYLYNSAVANCSDAPTALSYSVSGEDYSTWSNAGLMLHTIRTSACANMLLV